MAENAANRFAAMGLSPDDEAAKRAVTRRNYEFFDAPVVVYLCLCIAGVRHRPPEDVGGVSGYEEFLRVIRDPGHPEHDDYLVWAEKDTGGRKFDPEYFYINEVNRALAKVT